MSLHIWMGALEQGLLWGSMILGVYLTFRILNFPDLTVDGSFTLGAAVAARLILGGCDPWLATMAAVLAGAAAGLVTGLLHTQLKIDPLLSGILAMIALYSVNLRIMGTANLSLLRVDTIFTSVSGFTGLSASALALGGAVSLLVVIGLYFFLQTEVGLGVRATGDNPQMIRSLGVNTNTTKLIGLSLSNALVAVSGSLVGQYQSFADVGMGIGMIVVGLASVIIGEVLVRTPTIFRALVAALVGSIIYRAVIAGVLQLGMPATDLKLLTAAIVTVALAFPVFRARFRKIPLSRERSGQSA
ncbi:Branched-chain amino acid transport system / permease component [Pelotomaculum sp. FP]|uniref:ABC transporter permease n=1 Tax=Pelotomaculum sp. FP TaxID=261474 RepID=UPI0011010EAB|nr:ABC transporter permease [Pelotomaculum sp. FP]TEB16029.1 Branched-chain amino acid transport system / permease component [Pelotomaculum sp. FP]